MKEYNPKDWYWRVNGDQAQVFSSKTGDVVSVTAPAFLAWGADGTVPTPIDTYQNIGGVLAPLLIRPVHAQVLDGYLEEQCDTAVVKLLFKLIFKMNNDIRELKGQAALTPAQARAFVKSQL
jgi:hypothetical protein